MKAAIRERARELGFDACAFTTASPPETGEAFNQWLANGCQAEMGYLARNAEKRLAPEKVMPDVKSIIVVAASYHKRKDDCKKEAVSASLHGQIARYAQFPDYHDVLGERLSALAGFVQDRGGAGARCLWYADTGPVLERDFAQRAGLGFVGKHTNLIHRRLGNWILLGEILTTSALEPDVPERNRCGSCERCLKACPTGALTAPFRLDARRCLSYLTIEHKGAIPPEFRLALGNRIFGCDDCLAVCPWNRFARESALMGSHYRADLNELELTDLLALDEAKFKARFAGAPMLRAKRRGLLRNVCVALGNVGTTFALPALERVAQDPEPLIAEHTSWAIRQINGRAAKY